MLQDMQCLSSPCYSYWANYVLLYDWYSNLDQYTPPKNDFVRIPALGVWTAYSLVTLVTRVTGVAEVFLVGLGTSFVDPKKGLKEVFIHTPKNILRVINTPFMFATGTICTVMDPKFFIIYMLECGKANLKHARTRTIGSQEHEKDLDCIDGIVKRTFLKYQEEFRKIHGRQTWKFKLF